MIDKDEAVARALTESFRPFPEVEVRSDNLLAVARTAVVSPCNAYGFMDGGIDRAYFGFFGAKLERTVRDQIALRPEGHLPVGASLVVATGHQRIPYLVLAPTMLMPEHVPAENAYRAMRAVLRIAGTQREILTDVFCPGLGTGVGCISPADAAREMAAAYADWANP